MDEYPHEVDSDVFASLDRHLWEPAFHIEALTGERCSVEWTARNRADDHHLLVMEMRIDGTPIRLHEPRSWLRADRAAMEIPCSADRLRSAEVEMDLILFDHRRFATTRMRGRRGPTDPTKMSVEFDDAGEPILLPHRWQRPLTRRVTTTPTPE